MYADAIPRFYLLKPLNLFTPYLHLHHDYAYASLVMWIMLMHMRSLFMNEMNYKVAIISKVTGIGKVSGKHQSGDWEEYLSKVTGIGKVTGKHQSDDWEEYLSKVTGIGKVTRKHQSDDWEEYLSKVSGVGRVTGKH